MHEQTIVDGLDEHNHEHCALEEWPIVFAVEVIDICLGQTNAIEPIQRNMSIPSSRVGSRTYIIAKNVSMSRLPRIFLKLSMIDDRGSRSMA